MLWNCVLDKFLSRQYSGVNVDSFCSVECNYSMQNMEKGYEC